MAQTDWSSLGIPAQQTVSPPNASLTPFSSPTVSVNADGRLEVFAETDGAFWHAWQKTPGGSWG